MGISTHTKDIIDIIGEFKRIANEMSHIGGALDFPALPNGDGDGESELNDAIERISEILNNYVTISIDHDAYNSMMAATNKSRLKKRA